MASEKSSFFDTKIVIGLLILVFGVLLLLRNMGYDIGMSLWSYWPIILVILGLRIMLQPRGNRQLMTGVILIIVGTLLILHNLDIIRFGWEIIWPLLIILIGISFITGHIRRQGNRGIGKDHIDLSMILGGGDFRFDSKEFSGGTISAILGGGKVDLRDADMAIDEAVIDTFALMGGIEIWVPTSWQVAVNGTPILGGIENKTSTRATEGRAPKRLVVTGTAILGGIEVKN